MWNGRGRESSEPCFFGPWRFISPWAQVSNVPDTQIVAPSAACTCKSLTGGCLLAHNPFLWPCMCPLCILENVHIKKCGLKGARWKWPKFWTANVVHRQTWCTLGEEGSTALISVLHFVMLSLPNWYTLPVVLAVHVLLWLKSVGWWGLSFWYIANC